MGIFSSQNTLTTESSDLKNPNELLGAYIIDEISRLDDDLKEEFINSETCKSLQEARVLKKKTLVRLSKNDDLTRRKTMAAFQIAKDEKWREWDLLVKNRIKERELIAKIVQKAGNRADKAAKMGQKAYLSQKLPLAFLRQDPRKSK